MKPIISNHFYLCLDWIPFLNTNFQITLIYILPTQVPIIKVIVTEGVTSLTPPTPQLYFLKTDFKGSLDLSYK